MKRVLIVLLVLSIAVTAYAVFTGAGVRYVRPMHPQINTVGLVGHWKFYEGTAFDYSRNGNKGTLTGTTLTYRFPGLDLPGTNEYIEIDDHADFTPALTPFSINAWVYMHDATDFMIASKGKFNTDLEWWFYLGAGDQCGLILADTSIADCYIGRYGNASLTSYENVWVHLVVTYDGGTTSAGIKVYLDGVQIDDTNLENNTGSFVAIENLTAPIYIGRYDSSYANGLIDNVMIFNIEKSATEVKSIYEVTRWRYQK